MSIYIYVSISIYVYIYLSIYLSIYLYHENEQYQKAFQQGALISIFLLQKQMHFKCDPYRRECVIMHLRYGVQLAKSKTNITK